MDRFVVGSGRCGSTLLSRMLALHPDVLSIFEFFNGLDVARRFAPRLSALELEALFQAEQPFVTAALRRGYTAEEIVYPFDGPGVRYRLDDPLPWLCVAMAPRISSDPDSLYDAILDWASRQPERPAADHYRALFEWLAARQGRKLWIERSGSSIDYLGPLHDQFPEARFLHLHRDGREVALSMREHGIYRLPIAFLYDAPLAEGQRVSQLGGIDFEAAPDASDVISQILAAPHEPALFGRYWSDQIERGAVASREIEASCYREIRFEALVAQPGRTLCEIAGFFELAPDADWIGRAEALVRGVPQRRFPSLAAGERAALESACRLGRSLLQ